MERDIEIRRDVSYGGGPDGSLCSDLYLPKGPGPHPVLLCLHGGAWARGSHRQYQSWGPWLAARGYAAVAVDYRLSAHQSPSWPGVFDDVQRAFRWVVTNADALRIAPERLGVVGDSAGGHMAALLSLDDTTGRQVRAVVGVYGVYDLPRWWSQTRTRGDDPVGRLMGKSFEEARTDYEGFSPQHRLERHGAHPSAEYLIVYGDRDDIVHHGQSERFVETLKALGTHVESMLVPEASHSWFTWLDDHPGRRRVDQWPNTVVAPVLEGFLERVLG